MPTGRDACHAWSRLVTPGWSAGAVFTNLEAGPAPVLKCPCLGQAERASALSAMQSKGMGEVKKPDRVAEVLAAVLTGKSQAEAARQTGITEKTVGRYVAEHRNQLQDARLAIAEATADALAARTLQAIDRLGSIVDEGTDTNGISAARTILAESRAWRDTVHTATQIENLEDELAKRRNA